MQSIKVIELTQYSNRARESPVASEAACEHKVEILYKKVVAHFKGDLKGRTFGIWGLSFKPQTDDMREAPSLVIIPKLLEAGARIRAYDPVAMKEAWHHLGDKIEYIEDQYEALIDADCMVMITEWPEFRFPNFNIIKKLLKNPVIFDGRNIYDRFELKNNGFEYFCIGVDTTL